MAKTGLLRPTDTELDILRVLWQRGPSTVREVQETLNSAKPTGYTTVLKMLQIMTEKGLVRRDERQRAHVYEARLAREQTQQQLVTDLLERVFEGSATGLVMHALAANKKSSERELAQIRKMLDEFEQGEQ
ncbi:MAG TPA: BlaI/MecI/CopY family transcriptional regulator [Blastocatellia bacterium]|jgi:predicted transcriptional regulator|nr:BlaI/MecI/CopY family transcriptional regulator [Blastocatellia bacterium]